MTSTASGKQPFYVEIIKPSHYDDDGYVIQWMRAFIPSNSLACLWALAEDVQERQVLGEDVEIVLNGYDETHTVVPVQKIIKRIQKNDGRGLVLLAGVQSNQFPRAADLAKEFRAAGIQVAIGGFHVSGCISMLPELPPEIKAVRDSGVSLFAGEAEGRLEELLRDAHRRELKPVYNFLLDLPDLQGQITPNLPPHIAKGSFNFTAFDVGRGCPFRCSFCTIINVQGRKSRFRGPDDVERVVRTYGKKGVNRFFITDDNMARNKNWEAIFDRLIELREREGIKVRILIQVDTQCHKIPGFIEKAAAAGCNRVFIGMESVNPENLVAAKKFQNNIHEYRKMLQAWRDQKVITHAGYILGFPADTPESIRRDIKLMQEELPIDILEFFVMTPLPGSADHRDMYVRGDWMHPDLNMYDSEHVAQKHPRMSAEEWQGIYNDAWHLYYSPEHIQTLMRRAEATGTKATRMLSAIMLYYGIYKFEHLHPLQGGIIRRKVRTTRRPGFKRENPITFYPKRLLSVASTYLGVGLFWLKLHRQMRAIQADPSSKSYTDLALTPIVESAHDMDEEVATAHDHDHDHDHDHEHAGCADEGCGDGGCGSESDGPAIVPLTIIPAAARVPAARRAA